MSEGQTDKSKNRSGPVGKIARSGSGLAEQAIDIHRKASYAGLSLTSKLRGKGDKFFDSLIDVVETVQVAALEVIDKGHDDI
ncbi:MAG: hypothetical protein KAG92_00570, partial [Deltaproteobacteria bacterium]|nr:hypothetical protein [Deltaproteobacteria bacterium]